MPVKEEAAPPRRVITPAFRAGWKSKGALTRPVRSMRSKGAWPEQVLAEI